MYAEDDMLPLSLLQHFVYCERRAALLCLEQQWADNVLTAEGTLLHEAADTTGRTEIRGSIRIVRALYLHSRRLGLSGRADIVEFHQLEEALHGVSSGVSLPGVPGCWRPFPIEYKRGIRKREFSYEVQLCAQSICLEEMLGAVIPGGAIFWGKSTRRQEIRFTDELRRTTEENAVRLHELVAIGITPPAIYGPKCDPCSISSICLPKAATGRRRVWRYLSSVGKEDET
ncbi:CRISPR-associated protein Cas4 [bacterium]|nr:CRISPR-associated protein Cas4 [candidate division CSSED10-310 bacterium]